MGYPYRDHESVTRITYRVHDYCGVVRVFGSLEEARELYLNIKEEKGSSMITRHTTQIITLEDFEHVQGKL